MQTENLQLQKAWQMHQQSRFKEAEQEYRSLLAMPGADPSLYSYLADALNRQGRLRESADILEAAIASHAEQPYLKLSLGQTYLGMEETTKAKDLALALVAESPAMGEAHYLLGNIHMQENNTEEALQTFEKAAQNNPQLVEAHYNIGVLLYQTGDIIGAEAKWQEVLGRQPAFIPALLNLGDLELARNQYQKAIAYLEQVLQYDQQHPFAHKLTGMAKHFLGDIEGALHHYDTVLKILGPSGEVFTLLGNAHRDLNRISEAQSFYERVLEIQPDHTLAKENLEKIRGHKIEGWHFDMLGDLRRNEGYDQAIRRAVKGGETVLDIGTGSGLLSMMCARAGAGKVYTCETIKDIAEAAKEVIAANGYSEKITVFHARSNALRQGRSFLKKPTYWSLKYWTRACWVKAYCHPCGMRRPTC